MKQTNTEDRACRLCEYATPLDGGEHCLCKKRGVVFSYSCCSKFRLDLLKFSPAVRPTTTSFDFSVIDH